MPDVDAPRPAARPDRRLLLAIAALLVASALIVVLGRQNRALRVSHRELAVRADQPYVDMFVPVAAARGLDGSMHTLGAPGRAQILYFFTARCPFCKASIPAILSLAARLTGGELIGVGGGPAEELRDYARTSGFGFPIVQLLDDRARSLYRSRDVPMIMVIDHDGRVHHAHVGQLGDAHVANIVAAAAAIPAAPLDLTFQPGATQ